MNDQRFFDLCAKRFSGTTTPKEDKELTDLLTENAAYDQAYQELKKQWETSGQLRLKYQTNPQAAWERFTQMKPNHEPKTVRWVHFAYRLAAMIILTIGLGFLFREYGKTEPFYYATFEGETKWVILADSSRIRLNESSLLTVHGDFNEEERNVELKGEAYFEIARDESRPFNIQTGQAITRVLGTSFNIKAKEEESSIDIYVVSGKVSFSTEQDELILTKGMAANFSKESNSLALDTEKQNALAWHSKSLKFDDTPLDQVFADLQEYFDVNISMANNKIKNCRFTAEFKAPNLEEILKIISISANLSYTNNNNRYTIEGEGCSPIN